MNNGNNNKATELNFIQHKLESREGFCHESSPDDLDESRQASCHEHHDFRVFLVIQR
jgi:hypothetical protein